MSTELTNWRLDPWEDAYRYLTITDEIKTVTEDAALPGRYTIRLDHVPRKLLPRTLTVVQNISGGEEWGELNYSVPPSPGEYRILPDLYWSVAMIEFNEDDNGKEFLISYQGRGSPVEIGALRKLISQVLAVPGYDWSIGGDLLVSGDLSVLWGGLATPIAGWLPDGTPFYIKEISITMASGFFSGQGAHGIANAYTGDRIFNVQARYDSGSLIYGGSGATQGFITEYWTIDNTNLTIFRGASSGTPTFKCKIWYT